ncbi:MAG: trimeric autotransporter adhesin, partial [Pseudonocardiales bacterium]|nr:trimeric autotransporter adhesin [Pseudonocardiales bacterium]
ALGGAVLDGTAGYANIVQVRLLQSGGTNFWASDISYDSAAGTWTQVFPVVATATPTTTALAASPVGHQTPGGTVTLTATLSPSNSDGAVQFKDGATDVGSPVAVTSGTAQTTVTTLSAGAHSLSASFTPTDPSAFAASTSSALPYSIGDVPGAPSGVAGTAGNQAASVSWTAPASDGGSAITGYHVQYSANGGSTWTSAPASVSTAPARTVGGLTNATSYVFRVAAINSIGEGAFSGQSAAVVPVADGSSLTIGGSATLNYGATVTLRTVLKDARTNAAIPSASVGLYRRYGTSGPLSLVKAVTTSSTGAAAFAVKMTRFTQFQWRYAGTATHKATLSAVQTIKVAQVVSIRTTATTIVHGHTVKLYGGVAPAASGQVVYLQQHTATGWKTIASVAEKLQKLPNGATAVGYVFARTLSSRATYVFRVYRPATSTLLAGYSANLSVRSI